MHIFAGTDGQSAVRASGSVSLPVLPPAGRDELAGDLRHLHPRRVWPAGAVGGESPQRGGQGWVRCTASTTQHQTGG